MSIEIRSIGNVSEYGAASGSEERLEKIIQKGGQILTSFVVIGQINPGNSPSQKLFAIVEFPESKSIPNPNAGTCEEFPYGGSDTRHT
jgi:hypothetical protein